MLGTSNKAKKAEYSRFFAKKGIILIDADSMDLSHNQIIERGDSYQANALLKAQQYYEFCHQAVVSEDSGLEVDVLDGFPGIHSHRWVKGNDYQRNQALLEKLIYATTRSARFITVICLYLSNTKSPKFFQGELYGEISTSPHGDQGFGYDTIFIPHGYSRTIAELGDETKNKISARVQAMTKLSKFLQKS